MFYFLYEVFLARLTGCIKNFKYCINNINESIKLAILSEDLKGLDYIISAKIYDKNSKLLLQESSEEYLPLCYSYYNRLLFAEILIKEGAIFNSVYITYTMPFPNINKLKEHVNIIGPNIKKIELYRVNKIIESMNSSINVKVSNESFVDCLQTLLRITHTDDTNYHANFLEMHSSFINNYNPVINKLSRLLCQANYPEQDMKILAPIFSDHYSAFHNFGKSLIYVPLLNFDSLERATLIHEVGHYVMHYVFDNNGKPYSEHNIEQKNEYDIAATATLCNVGKLIGFQCKNSIVKGLKSHNVAFELLQKSVITLFYYRTLILNPKKDFETKSDILKIIYTKFGISHSSFEAELRNFIQKHNISDNLVILLERFGEYINRGNEDDYSTELIVRLPELIVRGLDDYTLSHLEPLQTLWFKISDTAYTMNSFQTNINYAESITNSETAGDSVAYVEL